MSFESALFGALFSTPQKNGLTRPKAVRGVGMPMVNMGELFAHPRIRDLPMDLVPVSEAEAHFLLESEDLLFARQSLVLEGAGQCSIFIGNKEPTVFESHLIRCRLNRSISNPYFYFYFFRSPAGRAAIETIAEQGAGASGIRGSDLVKLNVPCPPKAMQDAVATILTALDDRITLLRETNATLEAIAQALFKSWFVDFDPVRAKLEGRVPEGMDAATAELFPDQFESATPKTVPRGWASVKLGDIATNASVTYDFKRTNEVVFINTGDVLEGDFLHDKRSPLHGLPGQAKKSIREDDILFSEIRPENKRYAYVDFNAEDYLVSTKFMIIRTSPAILPRLLYRILTSEETLKEFQIQAVSRSGTFPQITFSSISNLEITLPTIEIQRAFQRVVTDIEFRIKLNKAHSKTFATLRDTLLPRLISGQLRHTELSD